MTGDKDKLLAYSTLEKEKKVTFGNDTPAVIKGKGSALLKENESQWSHVCGWIKA